MFVFIKCNVCVQENFLNFQLESKTDMSSKVFLMLYGVTCSVVLIPQFRLSFCLYLRGIDTPLREVILTQKLFASLLTEGYF